MELKAAISSITKLKLSKLVNAISTVYSIFLEKEILFVLFSSEIYLAEMYYCVLKFNLLS